MRLLILACSVTKRLRPGPATDVYDGPLYHVLRKAGAQGVLVYILSARYGLIPGFQWIEPYDQRMTPERAADLRDQVQETLSRLREWGHDDLPKSVFSSVGITNVHIQVGQVYRLALPDNAALVKMFGYPVVWGEGGIGQRCKQLKQWLKSQSRLKQEKAHDNSTDN